MDADTIYSRMPGFMEEVLDGEVLVHYSGSPRALSLNSTAAMVWSCCDGKTTASAIKRRLEDAYPAAAGRVAADVDAVLSKLVEFGALTGDRVDGSSSNAPPVKETGAVYTRRPDFLCEVLDDEVLLYYPGSLRAVRLNMSAAMIWSLCNGEASISTIRSLLEEAYPDAIGEIARDVDAAVSELRQFGVLLPT